MPTSDELNDLARAVAVAGDRAAFAVLFKHFAPRVKAYLIRSGTPGDVAEELAQETMVNVWRKAASFDPARARLSTWIFTIARHLRIDQQRRRKDAAVEWEPGDSDGHEDVPDSAAATEDQFDALEREEGVRRALTHLPADQALVLRLSFYEEQPHAAIARELCVPLGTVKSRIRLAVGHLRRLLERFEP